MSSANAKSKVQPVLTPDEWALQRTELALGDPKTPDVVKVDEWGIEWYGTPDMTLTGGRVRLVAKVSKDLAGVVALANHALPDSSPHKITRQMTEEIRTAAHDIGLSALDYKAGTPKHWARQEQGQRLHRIAELLEALLPPKAA